MRNAINSFHVSLNKYICAMLVLLFFLGTGEMAQARTGGTVQSALSSGCNLDTPEIVINVGDISVLSNVPTGTVLGARVYKGGYKNLFSCGGKTMDIGFDFYRGATGDFSGGHDGAQIFATNVPGVGITFGGTASCNDYGLGQCTGSIFQLAYMPKNKNVMHIVGENNLGNSNSDWGAEPYIQLVKTGDITPGVLFGKVAYYFMKDTDGSLSNRAYVSLTGNISVTSCDVLTPSVNIELGKHMTSEFTGANSTTASVDVPIQLQCPAGVGVLATLNATPDTSTTQPGAIKLTPSSGLTAGGIAVQLIDKQNNGVPVGTVSRLQANASGVVDFGWKARYLQTTSAPASVGDANASATVTIDYE